MKAFTALVILALCAPVPALAAGQGAAVAISPGKIYANAPDGSPDTRCNPALVPIPVYPNVEFEVDPVPTAWAPAGLFCSTKLVPSPGLVIPAR